jgi:hypothetical protein
MLRLRSRTRVLAGLLVSALIFGAVLIATIGTAYAHNAGFQVCKVADNSNGTVTGTFTFTVQAKRDGVARTDTFYVAVGYCSTPVMYDAGTAIVTESAHAGTSLVAIAATPSGSLVSSSLANRTATVTLTNFTTVAVRFTNRKTPPPPSGCTLTWGYYKTHSSVVTALITAHGSGLKVGSQTLSAAQVNFLLGTNENGPNYMIKLVHQLIAAELNQFGASTPAAVQTAINAANALIAAHGGALGSLSPTTTVTFNGVTYTASGLNNTLDGYNNGLAAGGPRHCSG